MTVFVLLDAALLLPLPNRVTTGLALVVPDRWYAVVSGMGHLVDADDTVVFPLLILFSPSTVPSLDGTSSVGVGFNSKSR